VPGVRARAPASSANLGPGFDTLGLALSLYVEVEVVAADELSVQTSGEGSEYPADASHLAAQVAAAVVGHDRLAITVHSSIPVGRGLGSSAALAAAAAAAAGATNALAIATAVDGHPDNAAASVLGGLITACTVDGTALARRLPLDPALAFVVLVPERTLPTEEARAALPLAVPHGDAAFNLGRMGLLLSGLADHRLLVRAATEDRLHQDQRASLFPEAPDLLAGLVRRGALASCWSGAGPTLLALCSTDAAPAVQTAGGELLEAAGVRGSALLLAPDLDGLVLSG
jgi:homoserine kinase